jgi:hypothetical protein
MPHPNAINPKTGKRYNWVDPRQEEREVRTIETQIRLLERQKIARQARQELLAFTRFTMPDPSDINDPTLSRYEEEKFHVAVAEALEAVERGEIRQLIFCMPPRHGKTELATKRFAAWYHGRHPNHDIAVASYSDTMAEDMGADTRAIMTSPQFKQVFPSFKLRRGGTRRAISRRSKAAAPCSSARAAR